MIEGYTVKLNPAKLDRALLVFIEVTLDRTSASAFKRVRARRGKGARESWSAHMVAGASTTS